MKWRVLAVGKPSLDYAKRGITDYERRLRRYASVELVYSKNEQEMERDWHAKAPRWLRVVLDERGTRMTTQKLASQVEAWQLNGVAGALCAIGGADGHNQERRDSADLVLSLSDFTLQHELALLVWMEQLYRVCSLLNGSPYHRP